MWYLNSNSSCLISLPIKLTFSKLQDYLKHEILFPLDSKILQKIFVYFYAEGFNKKQDDKNKHHSLLKIQPKNTIESIFNLEGFHNHHFLFVKYKIKFQQDVLYIDLIKRLPNFGFLEEKDLLKMTRKIESNVNFGNFNEVVPVESNRLFDNNLLVINNKSSNENSNMERLRPNDSFHFFEEPNQNSITYFGRDHFSNGSLRGFENSNLGLRDFKNVNQYLQDGKTDEVLGKKDVGKELSKPKNAAEPKKTTQAYNIDIETLYSKINKL